ncbi:hybrid sensor histidine kinase/response regulator transcription factor [Polaribacter sp.]|uniref:hybrid sensor histidine kinase/response regulator transcription factor n=1 Tax=Polaribacter sp. TaxID=1920175 RepID=UPI003F6963B1
MRNFFLLAFLSLSLTFLNGNLFSQQIIRLDKKDGLINGTINVFEKDSLGYIWIGTYQGLNKYSGSEFKNYKLRDDSQIKGREILDILNLNGDLYVISSVGSLFKYNYEFDNFTKLFSVKNNKFLSLISLNDSQLLIGMIKGFVVYDLKKNKPTETQYPTIRFNRSLSFYKNQIYSGTPHGIFKFSYSKKNQKLTQENQFLKEQDVIDFEFDKSGKIWVGTEVGGLFVLENNNFKKINLGQVFDKTYAIRKISFDKNNNALIAVDRLGLFVLNPQFKIVSQHSHNVDNENSLSQNSIYSIYVDETNAYWVGLREGGVNIIYEKDNNFKNIKHIPNSTNSISNNNIRSIYEAKNGDLWFGTENGVSKLSHKTWQNYNQDSKLYNTAILSIAEYENQLVLGTYGEGILSFNEVTEKVSPLQLNQENKLKFIFNVNSFEDNLWISGSDGPLSHYSKNSFVSNYSIGLVRSLVKGFEGISYAITITGFYEINQLNASVRKIRTDVFNGYNEGYDLNFDYVNNCIWIASKNGLYKYVLSDEKLEKVSEHVNEEIGTVYSIERDNMHNLYLGCISGLWKYNIKKKRYRKYDKQDGLLIEEFGVGASAKFKNGSIAFGGSKGAVVFNPLNLIEDKPISEVYLSNFQINGKEPDSLTLSNNINFNKSITLPFDKNSISFNFETIKFHGSRKNVFEWQLEGFDLDKLSSYGNKKITYSNLKPGEYKLKYTGYNSEGAKGEDKEITFIIKNPFWKSYLAILLYFLMFLLLVYLGYRVTQANNRKKFDENRIKFFVEVAHDIRTPVALIQLLVKQLSNQENIQKSIELIQKNTQNLNEYVTQLLDFQKIDKNQLKLTVSKVDLKDCLRNIINNFTPILQDKSMDIILEVKHIPVWFDVSKMKRIFYNLISNAIKYSNEGGEIKVKAFLKKDNLIIEFIDNGIGIPDKQQDLVFQRFTRGTNVTNKGIPGTGIGLLLSKKIIELHGGQIYLESKENVGSKFIIVLPSGSEHYNSDQLITHDKIENKDRNLDSLINKEKLILLVEDNQELRIATKTELSKSYKIIEAKNGKEGLLLALSKNPDIIITDVMMPKMDGKELTNLLKTNFKTSHIPIIMLTALADVDDKVKGLETGADAYLEKPFNVSVLNAIINNLLKSRENISRPLEDKKTEKKLTPDESFLSDIIAIIKENLTEKDFSIDTLAEKMGLSRSNLFRKLKGLIQMSPSNLIIKIKLNHAVELMKTNTNIRISDIAYEAGFQDPKYFSTLFKKHYGKTPKEFIDEV